MKLGKLGILALITIIFTPTVLLADPPPAGPTTDILNKIATDLDYLTSQVKPALNYQAQQNYKSIPDNGSVVAGNSAKISSLSAIDNALNNRVAMSLNDLLNNTINSTTNNSNNPAVVQSAMANLLGPDYPAPNLSNNSNNSIPGSGQTNTNLAALSLPYSLQGLLGSTYFNFGPNSKNALSQPPQNTSNSFLPATNDPGMNFIYYLSDLANPPSSIDYQLLASPNPWYDKSDDPHYNPTCGGHPSDYIIANCIQNNSNVQQYRLAYRSWVAMESVALSDLLHMYYNRMPVDNLGKQAGLTPANDPIYPNASVLQVDEYMAKRRLTPSWAQQVASEPPATVQRETLMVLAEMRYEEFQQRLATERLNATIDTLLLANLKSGKQGLDNSKDSMQCAVNPNLCTSNKKIGN